MFSPECQFFPADFTGMVALCAFENVDCNGGFQGVFLHHIAEHCPTMESLECLSVLCAEELPKRGQAAKKQAHFNLKSLP